MTSTAAAKRDSKSNIKDKEANRDNNNQKSSVNANNNNNNNTNNNKVVIVAPPQQIPHNIALAAAEKAKARTPSPISPSLQQLQQQQHSAGASTTNITVPVLKKRTGVVKQSVPPPVPPRGSPRSKSNLIGVSSSSFLIHAGTNKSRRNLIVVDDNDEVNVGCRKKVEEWLATIEPLAPQETLSSSSFEENTTRSNRRVVVVDQTVHFKSVGKLAEAFSVPQPQQQRQTRLQSGKRNRKIADSKFVKSRIDGFNSLDRYSRTTINRNLMSSDGGTDSGIDIPTTAAGMRICLTTSSSLNQRCHDEEEQEEFV